MQIVTLLGFSAGTLTTVAFLPQVIKTWKSKSTKDISLGMFVALCTGIALWLVYGFLLNEMPIIITNSVSLSLNLVLLVMKLRYK